MKPPDRRGWAQAARARRRHFFVGSRSLCGEWSWTKSWKLSTLISTGFHQPECGACRRRHDRGDVPRRRRKRDSGPTNP